MKEFQKIPRVDLNAVFKIRMGRILILGTMQLDTHKMMNTKCVDRVTFTNL